MSGLWKTFTCFHLKSILNSALILSLMNQRELIIHVSSSVKRFLGLFNRRDFGSVHRLGQRANGLNLTRLIFLLNIKGY